MGLWTIVRDRPVLCQILREGHGQLGHPILQDSQPQQDVSEFQAVNMLLVFWVAGGLLDPVSVLYPIPQPLESI